MLHCWEPYRGEYLDSGRAIRRTNSSGNFSEEHTMGSGNLRTWGVLALSIARIFFASTLLLIASAAFLHVTLYTEIVSLFALSLGAAIAVGWRVRYASVLALLGSLGTHSLAAHCDVTPVPADAGTTIALWVSGCALVCFGQISDGSDTALVSENLQSSNFATTCAHWSLGETVEVSLRIEDGRVRNLWKR